MSRDPNKKSNSSSITPEWNHWEGKVEMLFNETESGEPDVRAIETDGGLLNRCRLVGTCAIFERCYN
jgi:hypothetical protein